MDTKEEEWGRTLGVLSHESGEQGELDGRTGQLSSVQSGVSGAKCKGEGLGDFTLLPHWWVVRKCSPPQLWTKGSCPPGCEHIGCMVSCRLWLHQRTRDNTISDCSLLIQNSSPESVDPTCLLRCLGNLTARI